MSQETLELVEPGDPIPPAWWRCIVLHGTGQPEKGWRTWSLEVVDRLRSHHYEGCVLLVPPLRGIGLGQDNLELASIRWLSAAFGRADAIVSYLAPSAELTDLFWLLSCRQVAARILVLQTSPSMATLLREVQHPSIFRNAQLVTSAEEAVAEVLERLRVGAIRFGPERGVPLEIWQTAEFSNWYARQRRAGNSLKSAEPVWLFRSGPESRSSIWYWALHVAMHIGDENRLKMNEPIISRPNIAAVLLYRLAHEMPETEIVLVKEFSSPGSGSDGYLWELPSGSADSSLSMIEAAALECSEEVGLNISRSRLRYHGMRQLASTMSIHQAFLYTAALSLEELAHIRHQHGVAHGANPGERRFLRCCR